MMQYVEELMVGEKTVLCFDFAGSKKNDDFLRVINDAKEAIVSHKEKSVYTITNVGTILYDTKTKELVAQWMEFNKPYVICGAVTGLDGIKKIMVNAIFKMSGRDNMKLFYTKEQAIEWISGL